MRIKYLFLVCSILSTSAYAIDQKKCDEPWCRQYVDVTNFLHKLAADHPDTVKPVVIGKSDSGKDIEGVAIGNGAIHNLVVGTHHGNEYGATEVAMAFAKSVAENPLAGQTMYVIPVLNISGYNHKNRQEMDSRGYNNDPNRDYPGPCGTSGPHHLKSTAALAQFIDKENIVVSATLHTYFPAVVYPWGLSTWDTGTAYDDIFNQIALDATFKSHYTVGNSTQVIYPADGAFEDYAFWKFGIWSMLFEMGHTHHPSQRDIDEMIRTNVPGLRNMFEKAPRSRAENHAFTGRCDVKNLSKLDLHNE